MAGSVIMCIPSDSFWCTSAKHYGVPGRHEQSDCRRPLIECRLRELDVNISRRRLAQKLFDLILAQQVSNTLFL